MALLKNIHIRTSGTIIDGRTYLRSVYAETLLEDFFISAVLSVIGIRFYLWATGYPQISGGGLHIAHVLFGGILMLIAMVVLIAFVTHNAKRVAAIVGGIGFGTFIDELGKFITSDNNYFYEPTVALIYVVFILLYFGIRFIIRRQALSREEHLINTLSLAQNAFVSGLDSKEVQMAQRLIQDCEKAGIDTYNLKTLLHMNPSISTNASRLDNVTNNSLQKIDKFMAKKWRFIEGSIVFWSMVTVTPIYLLLATVQWSWQLITVLAGCALILSVLTWFMRNQSRKPNFIMSAVIVLIFAAIGVVSVINLKPDFMSVSNVVKLIFPSVSAVLMMIGLLLIPYSHVKADRMFARAIMVSIFLTQIFAFYEYQLMAMIGLVINIVTLLVLRHMIMQQHEELKLDLSEFEKGKEKITG